MGKALVRCANTGGGRFVVQCTPVCAYEKTPRSSVVEERGVWGVYDRAMATRSCDYCTSEIPEQATRCPQCSGEFRRCPAEGRLVGMTTKQKFVGVLRGGTKTQYRCMHCDRVLDGPRF